MREKSLHNLHTARTPDCRVEWRTAMDVGGQAGSVLEEKFGKFSVSL